MKHSTEEASSLQYEEAPLSVAFTAKKNERKLNPETPNCSASTANCMSPAEKMKLYEIIQKQQMKVRERLPSSPSKSLATPAAAAISSLQKTAPLSASNHKKPRIVLTRRMKPCEEQNATGGSLILQGSERASLLLKSTDLNQLAFVHQRIQYPQPTYTAQIPQTRADNAMIRDSSWEQQQQDYQMNAKLPEQCFGFLDEQDVKFLKELEYTLHFNSESSENQISDARGASPSQQFSSGSTKSLFMVERKMKVKDCLSSFYTDDSMGTTVTSISQTSSNITPNSARAAVFSSSNISPNLSSDEHSEVLLTVA